MKHLFSKFLVAFFLTSAVVLSWSEYFFIKQLWNYISDQQNLLSDIFYQNNLICDIGNQDKVDGNRAESNINNNWENRQQFSPKVGVFMVSCLNSTIEKIQFSNVFLVETQFFTYLEEITSNSNTFAMLNLIIKHKIHFYRSNLQFEFDDPSRRTSIGFLMNYTKNFTSKSKMNMAIISYVL